MEHDDMMRREANGLIDFLNASPCNFWAVDTIRRHLSDNGYTELDMSESWRDKLHPGGKHFVIKNSSAQPWVCRLEFQSPLYWSREM